MKILNQENPDVSTHRVLPERGDGVTVQVGSDQYAGYVEHVTKSGKHARIKLDRLSSYEKVYMDKDGFWRTQGNVHWHVTFGIRTEYRDRSF